MKNLFFPAGAQPLFSFSDAEGFFGLMADNLVQYVLIIILLTGLVGLQRELAISSGLQLPGLVALSQGFMLSSVVWGATAVCLVERRLTEAAAWMGAGAVMAFFGFIHAGETSVEGNLFYSLGFATGAKWAAGYAFRPPFSRLSPRLTAKAAGARKVDR